MYFLGILPESVIAFGNPTLVRNGPLHAHVKVVLRAQNGNRFHHRRGVVLVNRRLIFPSVNQKHRLAVAVKRQKILVAQVSRLRAGQAFRGYALTALHSYAPYGRFGTPAVGGRPYNPFLTHRLIVAFIGNKKTRRVFVKFSPRI